MLHIKNGWIQLSRSWVITCIGFVVAVGLPFIVNNPSTPPQQPVLPVIPPQHLVNLPTAIAADHGQVPKASGPPVYLGTQPTGVVPGQFVTEHFVDAGGARMTYYLYVPRQYDPTQRYPLVLLLHGADESANLSRSAERNRANLLNQNYVREFVAASVQDKWPSFVVVPQISGTTARWVNVPGGATSYHLSSKPSSSLQRAIDIVATLQHTYTAVDGNRLYITGISMGGYGVWDAVERWPGMFAAAVPISGAGDPHNAGLLTTLPIWDFHGGHDTLVPASSSRKMHSAIAALGGMACYTEVPGYSHDLWNTIKVYANATFLSWLFAQTQVETQGKHPPSCKGLVVHGVPAK